MRTAIVSGLTLLLSFNLLPPRRAAGMETSPSVSSQLQRPPRTPPFSFPRPPKPDPVVVVDATQANEEALLSKEEIERIARLQNTVFPRIVSEPNPDGSTIVIEMERLTKEAKQKKKPSETPETSDPKPDLYQFLNIQTGQLTSIPQKSLETFEIVDDFRWQSADVAITIAYPKDSHDGSDCGLLTIDRRTVSVRFEPLSLPAAKLSLALDGTRLLVEIVPEEKESESHRKKRTKRHASEEPKPEMAAEESEESTKPALKEFRILSLPDKKELYRFNIPSETSIQSVAWTEDSSKIAIIRSWEVEEEESPFASVGERFFSPQTRDTMGILSPAENPNLQKNALLVIDLVTGQKTLRYAAEGGERAAFWEAHWSPDGQMLLTTMLHPTLLPDRPYPIYGIPQWSSIRFYNSQLQELHRLEKVETGRISGSSTFQARLISSDEAVLRVLNGMDLQLYLYNRRSGALKQLSTQSGNYSDYTISKTAQGYRIVFAYSSFTHPPELYRLDRSETSPTLLTTFNQEVTQQDRIRVDRVTFKLANGEVLEGRLLQAANAPFPPQNKPLIVWQEGGPYAEMMDQWSAEVESPYSLLPSFGFPMLIVPLYGRYGFGEKRFNALYNSKNFGHIDIDAMAEIVTQAIDRGYTSADKVGITGCSYGGYFTTQSLVRHPDLYAAANAQCSWIDLLADWTQGFPGVSTFTFGPVTPYDHPTAFQSVSPIYNSGRIETPLLLFKGDQDYLPIGFDENLYWMIATRGVPSRMVRFIGAKHGLFSQEYQKYAAQEMIEWFRTYLEGREPQSSTGKR